MTTMLFGSSLNTHKFLFLCFFKKKQPSLTAKCFFYFIWKKCWQMFFFFNSFFIKFLKFLFSLFFLSHCCGALFAFNRVTPRTPATDTNRQRLISTTTTTTMCERGTPRLSALVDAAWRFHDDSRHAAFAGAACLFTARASGGRLI